MSTLAPSRIIKPEDLFEGQPTGFEKAPVDVAMPGVEVEVVRFKADQEIPYHSHSEATLKTIISGSLSLTFDDGRTDVISAGEIYPCLPDTPYFGRALEDTLMVLVQPAGAHRVDHQR